MMEIIPVLLVQNKIDFDQMTSITFEQWCKENNPQLLKEWHSEKNTKTPADYKPNTASKVWWLGPCGHEWESSIGNRIKGHGCPYCSNHKVLAGFNDLSTTHPELAKQWHPTRNGELLPSEVLSGSTKKVWWLGPCGHEWESIIYLRERSDKCPICEGRLVIKGINDLSTTHPELAKQWDQSKNSISPSEVNYHSNKKYWWQCEKGHEWQAPMSRRVKGSQCPYCDNHKVKAGYNDLATTHPDIAKQWHPTKNGSLTPSDVNAGTPSVAWWLGPCGHEWDATICSRTKYGFGCPYCSSKRLLRGFNDLLTINPDLAKQWHPTKNHKQPSDYFAGSPEKVWWVCPFGHEWKASIVSRNTGIGCPICFQSSTTSFQEKAIAFYLARYYDIKENYSPDGFGRRDIDIFIPSLSIGVEYDGERYHRSMKRDLEKNILCKKNQITLYRIREEKLPDLEDSINYYVKPKGNEPLEKAITSLLKDILLKDGKQLDITPNIARDEIAIMEKQYTSRVENSLKKVHPELVKDLHPTKNGLLKAEMLPVMSNRSVWWQCEKGHDYKSTISNHVKGNGCPICSNKKVLIGYNDLATTHPDITKQWHSTKNGKLKPTDVTAGNKTYVWWQCEKGHEWKSRISTRLSGSNCPVCANQVVSVGFNDLATLYPSIAAQWHSSKNGDLKPNLIVPGSHKKIWWQCEKGHEWQVAVYHRIRGNTGCPYCSGKEILSGFNDLKTLRPDIAKEWHPTKNSDLLPSNVGLGNLNKVWWQCEKGHEWLARVGDRCGGTGCPICAGRMIMKGYNDLATTHPDIAKQWHPTKNGDLTPYDVSHGMIKKVWWLGPCGHEWEASISDRVKGKTGCPICCGKRVLIGFNDLNSLRPDIAKEWHPTKNGNLKPTDVTLKSNKKVWWLGACGHEWETMIINRTNGKGCPYCLCGKR